MSAKISDEQIIKSLHFLQSHQLAPSLLLHPPYLEEHQKPLFVPIYLLSQQMNQYVKTKVQIDTTLYSHSQWEVEGRT